ncbi:hypothetical protein ACSFBI_01440 [Variovorax sp. RB3P1]|uniref:hypothetical protein n=1 Tax=Variovorax sp. RB3P1 TaxID=3443732 RepID=UPI003F475646
MTDNTSTADTKAPTPAAYSKAEPGAIDPARYCGNCTHLRSDVDADEHPEGMCGRFGWDLLDENIARCTGHQTKGEKVVGLHRPGTAIGAPTEQGTSAAHLDALAEALSFTEVGDTKSPDFLYALCEMVESAPPSYFDQLEATQAGAAAEWKKWAVDHRAWLQDQQDRADYPDFFSALAELREITDRHGKDAAHEPEHVGIFVRLFESAPPRYRAEAEKILAPCVPKATHANDDGEPVFSLAQLSETLGEPVEKLQTLVDEYIDPARLYRGAVHAIQ